MSYNHTIAFSFSLLAVKKIKIYLHSGKVRFSSDKWVCCYLGNYSFTPVLKCKWSILVTFLKPCIIPFSCDKIHITCNWLFYPFEKVPLSIHNVVQACTTLVVHYLVPDRLQLPLRLSVTPHSLLPLTQEATDLLLASKRFACSLHFTKIEPHTLWPLASGFSHLAGCLEGSTMW